MFRSLHQKKDLPSEILNVLQAQERVQRDYGDFSQHVLEISHRTANIILEWGLPPAIATAALLSPIVECHSDPILPLTETFDEIQVGLAKQLTYWHSSIAIANDPDIKPSRAKCSILLR